MTQLTFAPVVRFGHGVRQPELMYAQRSVVLEALAALGRHTGPVEFHLAAAREIAEQVAQEDPGQEVVTLSIHPAHAEALVELVWMAQTEILATCPGVTRRERRTNADAAKRKRLRKLSGLRNQAQAVTFTMANGLPFSLGAKDEQTEAEVPSCTQ